MAANSNRTVRLTRIPAWVHLLPDECVVPAISNEIYRMGAMAVAVIYNPPNRRDISVEFYHHGTADSMINFCNDNLGSEITMEWSTRPNLWGDGSHPDVVPCDIHYRETTRDTPAVIPPTLANLPKPLVPPAALHILDREWFCRECPWEWNLRRQLVYEPYPEQVVLLEDPN